VLVSHLIPRGVQGPGVDPRFLRLRYRVLQVEHLCLALAIGTGALLTWRRGWGLGHARWWGLKLGLVGLLVVPLEGIHAWASHVWLARGLRETPLPPFSKDLVRGAAMEEMIRTLGLPLLAVAVPLLLWLSWSKPF